MGPQNPIEHHMLDSEAKTHVSVYEVSMFRKYKSMSCVTFYQKTNSRQCRIRGPSSKRHRIRSGYFTRPYRHILGRYTPEKHENRKRLS